MYNYMQPQPIGNIMNIGGNGYNSSYYGGMNGGYFNPYYHNKQQEAARLQAKEQQRHQSDIRKMLANKANGISKFTDDIDEHNRRYDMDAYVGELKEIVEYNRFVDMYNNKPQLENMPNYALMHSVNISMHNKQSFPDDMNTYEYLAKAGEILQDIAINKAINRNKDMSQLYDRGGYQNLLRLHQGGVPRYNSTFSSRFNPNTVSIDDMEVMLPDELNNEYYAKKKAFLENMFK